MILSIVKLEKLEKGHYEIIWFLWSYSDAIKHAVIVIHLNLTEWQKYDTICNILIIIT